MSAVNTTTRILVIQLVLLLSVFFLLYRESVVEIFNLWSDWSNQHYTHGFLILGISIYMIYRDREKFINTEIDPAFSVIPFLIVTCFIWFAGIITGVLIVHTTILVFILFFILFAVTGKSYAVSLFVPVGYLLFAMPVWEPLMPTLQRITAFVAYQFLELVNISALRQDITITIPEGVFKVEESCSGLRYLNASLALGVLYAYLSFNRWNKIVICMALSLIIPIIANWIRVIVIIYAGHKTDMTHPLVHDHINFGWFLYAVFIFPFIWYGGNFADEIVSSRNLRNTADNATSINIRKSVFITVLVVVCLCTGPILEYMAKTQNEELSFNSKVFNYLDQTLNMMPEYNDSWVPDYNGAKKQLSREILDENNNRKIYLYIATYSGIQEQGAELINVTNSITGDKSWQSIYSGTFYSDSLESYVEEKIIENKITGEKRLVWFWYSLSGQRLINRYYIKLYQLWGILTGDTEASVIAVAIPVDTDQDRIREYINHIFLQLKDME